MSLKDSFNFLISESRKRKRKEYLFCKAADGHELFKETINGKEVYKCRHCGMFWYKDSPFTNELLKECKLSKIPLVMLSCKKNYKEKADMQSSVSLCLAAGEFTNFDYFHIEAVSFDDNGVTCRILTEKPLAVKGYEKISEPVLFPFGEEICFFIPPENSGDKVSWSIIFSKIS